MTALLRYQFGLLFRSHRWVFPLVGYALLLAVGGGARQPLGDALNWSAAILVPAAAVLTRLMLTVEPGAARACVATAAGPARAQLATLITALAAGAVLGLAGAGYALLAGGHPAHLARTLAAGLLTALVCLLVGSAVGALLNPPVIRHAAVAVLATTGAVVLAWVWNVSPASAALRGAGGRAAWVPLAGALALAAAGWAASCWLAGRRGE